MKNILISLSLLLILTGFGAFVFSETAGARNKAQNDLLTSLLNLPGPPPPNPLLKGRESERDGSFYSKKNPPADDAPIQDLMDYWREQSQNYAELGYNIKPSEKVLSRLLDEVEKDHSKINDLLNILPDDRDTADFVKRIFDSKGEGARDGDDESVQKAGLRNWLKYNSPYFSDELAEAAREAKDSNEYVTNQRELLSLASVDFSKAQPIINRLYNDPNQPVSRVLARWALYLHALNTDSFGDIERYRDELKAIVEDKQAKDGMRDLALDALVKEKDWAGRDEWYYGLLEDETLADLRVDGQRYTGLTTAMYYAPPEKHAKRMIELLKSGNPTVRKAAIANLGRLINKDNPEVVEALLPWLENPNWAEGDGGERNRIIDALQGLTLPDSVPGLISLLDEKERRQVLIDGSGSNSNTVRNGALNTSEPRLVDVESYGYRGAAIPALAMQKDIRAVPALKRVLTQVEEYERIGVIRAIWTSHGYSVAEQVGAVEEKARMDAEADDLEDGEDNRPPIRFTSDPFGSTNIRVLRPPSQPVRRNSFAVNSNMSFTPREPISGEEIKSLLGNLLLESHEADEPLVNGVIDRIAVLERREPDTAKILRKILLSWKGPAINAMLLRDLKNGKATVDTVVKLLSMRKELAEKQLSAVNDTRGGGPIAEGVAACILNDSGTFDGILGSESAELKTALLACARLVRADLRIEKVEPLLKAADKALALAADRYLESNDSPEARAAVLRAHPGEARIMGATTFFAPGEEPLTGSDFIAELFESIPGAPSYYPIYLSTDYAKSVLRIEKKLQKELRENTDLLGVYAYDDYFVRMYKDRAVFSWEDDPSRYYERTLSKEEFESLKTLLGASDVDSLKPFLADSEQDYGSPLEFLALGRHGGRRVFYMQSGEVPEFFNRLDDAFAEMNEPAGKLHYWIEKDVPGLEVLLADDLVNVDAVWKDGDDVRVLIDDPDLQVQINQEIMKQEREDASKEGYDYQKGAEINIKRREAKQYDHLSWRKLVKGKFTEPAGQPPGVEIIPPRDTFSVRATSESWKSRTGALEIRADSDGLYKISRGQETRIRDGMYASSLIASNGRWALAIKLADGMVLSRVDLTTNKEILLDEEMELLVFVPSLNKALVRTGGRRDDELGTVTGGQYFLLDPDTMKLVPVKGEAAPLAQQTYRPLQPTGTPDEFWAAIPDNAKKETRIGIYNAKTLTFKPLQKIPELSFSSMDMWVDEKEKKVLIVYVGHLLSVPLSRP